MRKTKPIRMGIKSPLIKERLILINRVVKEMLTESFDRLITTEYEKIEDGIITIYRFQTDSGNSYDLEFIHGFESGNIVNKEGLVTVIDIAFVPSEINTEDRENHDLYSKETNRGEVYELMGRISYLVKDFITNNNYNIYVFGKNTKYTKQKIYNNMYDNIFSDDFIKIEGDSIQYDEGAFFFVKNPG
jgi:hypothetical protein